MTEFVFRLESLMKLREAEREQRRRELAEAFHAEGLLRQQTSHLQTDLREMEQRSRVLAAPGRVHIDQALDTHRYKVLLQTQLTLLGQREKQLQLEIEKRRQAVTEADRDVKVLEKLRERQWLAHQSVESRRESRVLDEVAVQRWNRQQGDAL